MKRLIALSILTFWMAAWASWAEAYTATDYYNAGFKFYAAKNYSQAIPYFTYALRMDPNNVPSLQGRGNCYYFMGQYQLSMDDYQKVQILQPSPQVANFIRSLQMKISPLPGPGEVLQNTAPSGFAPASSITATSNASPAKEKTFGIRLEPAFYLAGLGDLNDAAKTDLKVFQQIQQSDPSLAVTGSVPSGYFGGSLELMVKLGPSFGIGLPFAFLPIGSFSEAASDDNGNRFSSLYDISAFAIGLDAWGFLPLGKDFQIFAAAGPLFVPVNISYNSSSVWPGVTDAQNGIFSSTAFGGQIKTGIDWNLGPSFVISPMVGYQFVSANSAQGTLTNAQTGVATTVTEGQLEIIPTPKGNGLIFLSNAQTAPVGARPLEIDLSGLKAGLQFSAFF